MAHCVLLTRPEGFNDDLAHLLELRGMSTLCRPLLKIVSKLASAESKTIVMNLDEYDCIIFISRNAVQFGLPVLEEYWPQWPQLNWFAVGKSTAAELKVADISAEFPQRSGSEGLLDLERLKKVQGQKVLIVRGGKGRELLASELSNRGADIQYLEVYERTAISYGQDLASDTVENRVNLCVVTSAEGLKQLQASLNSIEIGKLTLVVPSQRLEILARDLGMDKVQCAQGADDESLLEKLLEVAFLLKK